MNDYLIITSHFKMSEQPEIDSLKEKTEAW